MHQIDETDFRAEANLSDVLGLSERDSHDAIQRALLTVAGLNQRLAEMQHYSSVVNFWYRDLPLLGQKLSYLQSVVAPELLDERTKEVLLLPDLPDLAESLANGEFNMEKFLEIRSTDEGKAFRAWLHTATKEDLNELRDRAHSLRARLGVRFRSAGGRAIRLLTTTGIGLVPVAGLVLGPAASALDTFLLERLFGEVPAPLSFLMHKYSTVLKRRN